MEFSSVTFENTGYSNIAIVFIKCFERRWFRIFEKYCEFNQESEIIKEKNVGLIIVDSLTSHFRADYSGRGMLADRQQKLNRHLHTLQRIADIYNLAVVVTNQVMARPDFFFGDPTAPIGGHVVAHSSTFRIYLRRSKGGKRVARLIDSPCLPEGEAIFSVGSEGVRD